MTGVENAPVQSVYMDLFDASISLCRSHSMTPFELFDQSMDEVIMLLNYYIVKGDTAPKAAKPKAKGHGKQERVRVNDKTATGGWF